jgi:hypothetical protein
LLWQVDHVGSRLLNSTEPCRGCTLATHRLIRPLSEAQQGGSHPPSLRQAYRRVQGILSCFSETLMVWLQADELKQLAVWINPSSMQQFCYSCPTEVDGSQHVGIRDNLLVGDCCGLNTVACLSSMRWIRNWTLPGLATAAEMAMSADYPARGAIQRCCAMEGCGAWRPSL